MKKSVSILALLFLTVRLLAQTNASVKLAIIAETSETARVADFLTAALSRAGKFQLLERNEIEKVYREEGLSAANRDDLKLGRILGADGVLLLNVMKTPQATNLTTRLIAVKPGVILTEGSFPWPLKDPAAWAETAADYLNSFWAKLTLPAKEAIPISVVNLRGAIASSKEQEAERQLKLLTIQRLSQERQFFVLERQKMQLLGEEKNLSSDESAFWDGSYLLDGVVDQNGYSKDTMTVNARLIPPRGGAPLLFEVSGSRTNLAEVVNSLAAKVAAFLKVKATIKEWSATDEANQFFNEAKWALRWGVFSDAEASADSAWALGKIDSDCALVRIKAYESEVSSKIIPFEKGEMSFAAGTEQLEKSEMKEVSDAHVATMVKQKGNTVRYVAFAQMPDSQNIDRAFHALELYYEFNRNSSASNLIQAASETSNWKNSNWYDLGVEDLTVASRVLRNFDFVPDAQKPVADKLAELRALARSVANLISVSPSVHDSYFVGNRVAVYDELANTVGEDGGRNPNIFSCEAAWGCFWQETPEDCVALYRKLMSSPVFCYIQTKFWFPSDYDYRRLPTLRLAAWNDEDRNRIPVVWNSFVQELDGSTNLLLQLEAKALKVADAEDEMKMAESFTNLYKTIFEHSGELVSNNVDVLHGWQSSYPVGGINGSDIRDLLERLYYSKYYPKLEALDGEYRKRVDKLAEAAQFLPTFEKQEQYLKNNKSFDFQNFAQLFLVNLDFQGYSKSQALEIQPLVTAYKSNLVAQSQSASGMQRAELMSAISQVGFVENDIERALNPPPPSQPTQTPKPMAAAKAGVAVPTNAPSVRVPPPVVTTPTQMAKKDPESSEVYSNVLLVKNFLRIPVTRIPKAEGAQFYQGDEDCFAYKTVGSRWMDGKLVLDFRFDCTIYLKATGFGGERTRAVAFIFDPENENWEIIPYPPESQDARGYPRWPQTGLPFELYQNNFYLSDGDNLKEYDRQTRQWKIFPIPGLDSAELYAVGERLYAANQRSIFEITDGGKTTRILASTRRRPAESALDSMETLGFSPPSATGPPLPPELFSGPDQAIYANIGKKIFRWNGKDWRETFDLNISQPPESFGNAVIFRSIPSWGSDDRARLWIWNGNESAPELALSDPPKHPGPVASPVRKAVTSHSNLHPLWQSLNGEFLTSAAATFYESNLYFFVDHAVVTNVHGQWIAVEKNGCHAKLVCLSRNSTGPTAVPLKFDTKLGQPPLKILTEQKYPWLAANAAETAMYFSGGKLFLNQRNSLVVWMIPVSDLELAIAAAPAGSR
jgi:Curli production assembly/transport component CsgG